MIKWLETIQTYDDKKLMSFVLSKLTTDPYCHIRYSVMHIYLKLRKLFFCFPFQVLVTTVPTVMYCGIFAISATHEN